jgi:hypothetical protein
VYRRLARRVADDIADYLESGFEVVEIVGVGGSPSCGVSTTLDLDRAIAAMARVDTTTDIRSANRDVVTDNVTLGRGLFIGCLDRELAARGMSVLHTEHDLIAELTRAGAVATRAPPLDDTDQHRPDSAQTHAPPARRMGTNRPRRAAFGQNDGLAMSKGAAEHLATAGAGGCRPRPEPRRPPPSDR